MEASFGIWRTCVPFARDLLAIFLLSFPNPNLLNWLNRLIIDRISIQSERECLKLE